MFGIHPGVIFAIATAYAIAVFFGVWYFLNFSHNRLFGKWHFFNKFLERTRRKGDSPLIKKYGLVGLAMLLAVPFPTIGVYGAASLSWMLGVNRWRALLAVISGISVSNSIVLLSLLGVIHLTTILG